MATAKKSTVKLAEELAQTVLEEMGLQLWDVTFAKEGSVWILRYLIDKEGGISIDECEAFSRAIEERLDSADPIEQSYTLEVSSPGIERELTKDWHFDACQGELVDIRLYKPIDGVRDFTGELSDYQEGLISILLDEETEMQLNRSEAAFIRLHFDF